MMTVKTTDKATEILISEALVQLLECGAEITHDTLIHTLDDNRVNVTDRNLRMSYSRAIDEVRTHQRFSPQSHCGIYHSSYQIH
ncbi:MULTISPECIES: hypothetical protein [Enterobacteriaceae]|jgi:hypothetical protein|nr:MULTISPECIES: hypothetical protein [Phytobacter]MDU4153536.1 hypothetical protein [Enterobacteriaceae bacterium]MBY6258355.1 hypothetical protein [Phytobacter diazotrophicus]MDU7377972.1 hypothetical protein [Enterobacteriaceae bacterium]MDV2902046.1 hypothetical protein [Phytobacter diazotrophicus]QJF15682.1 hypothetical protein HHA33_03620 [Phytobacter diazotrophicus]